MAANLSTCQVTVKNAWPDGSAKFAVVAGRANLTAGTPIAFSLSPTSTAPAGAALTTTDLRNTGIAATTGCGAFGSVTWTGADWDAPFQAWVSGAEMSSWVYRKQVGSDAHLMAWLEVRLFAGGAVEVLPWIENGYLNVAGPTNKSATFTFTLGGAQRFSAAIDLPNHCRTPLVSGTALSHWLGSDPDVVVKHDTAYLQATELVPSYRGVTPPSAARIAALPSTFVPLQQGNYTPTMSGTGYQVAIGLLPEWDVLYLTSTASSVWAALQRNAYSAGRYGIHHRDETTQRPLRFSSYPTTVVGQGAGITATGGSSTNTFTPDATGTSPEQWDCAHHPSVGYMAYLVTGRWYFMEDVQFAATTNYMNGSTSPRENGNGVFASWSALQTRGAAWGIRTLAQAACITPDSDATLRTEFLNAVTNNVNTYHTTYVATPNNAFGWVRGDGPNGGDGTYGVTGDNKYIHSTWMQDFHTAAFGYMLALDLGVSSTTKTKLQAFFAWKAQSVVGRLGGITSTEYNYKGAAQYTIVMAPSDTPNFETGVGPWYANWGALYQAQLGVPNPGTTGPLNGTIEITSYWGNLQPAIAYAVRHGVPGALAAYNRMTSASNWATLRDGANIDPVWGVQPAVIP